MSVATAYVEPILEREEGHEDYYQYLSDEDIYYILRKVQESGGSAKAREECRRMVEHETNLDSDREHMTALRHCVRNKDKTTGKILLEFGADADHMDQDGNTALGTAIVDLRPGRAQQMWIALLMEHGANPERRFPFPSIEGVATIRDLAHSRGVTLADESPSVREEEDQRRAQEWIERDRARIKAKAREERRMAIAARGPAEKWFEGARGGPPSHPRYRDAGEIDSVVDLCRSVLRAPWQAWWTYVRGFERGGTEAFSAAVMKEFKAEFMHSPYRISDAAFAKLWRRYVGVYCRECERRVRVLPDGNVRQREVEQDEDDGEALVVIADDLETYGQVKQALEIRQRERERERELRELARNPGGCGCGDRSRMLNLVWLGDREWKAQKSKVQEWKAQEWKPQSLTVQQQRVLGFVVAILLALLLGLYVRACF